MKGLFQCPPWARGFCPFRACGTKLAKVQSFCFSFNFSFCFFCFLLLISLFVSFVFFCFLLLILLFSIYSSLLLSLLRFPADYLANNAWGIGA